MSTVQRYLNSGDVQRMLGVSPRTLVRMRANGLPHHKASKRLILYKENEVREFIEKGGRK